MTIYAVNVPDHCGAKENAAELALRIEAYWRQRGARAVKVWAQHEVGGDKSNNTALYVVRSNMVGGLPPRTSEARA